MKNWLRSQIRAVHAYLLWQWARWRRGARLPLTGARTLIVAPHPDDETIGCGGLIALKRREGTPVGVVFLTDGRYCYGAGGPPEDEVIETRHKEALCALSTLRVPHEQAFFLNLTDGNLGTLSQNERDQAIVSIASIIRELDPEEIYLPHREDHHKDHEAAFLLIQDALCLSPHPAKPKLIEYVIWHFWESPLFRRECWRRSQGARHLPVAEVVATKRRAISTYRSQLALLPRGFVWEHSLPVELFYTE